MTVDATPGSDSPGEPGARSPYDDDAREMRRVKTEVLSRLVPSPAVEPPKIGRFSILRRIGQGGMGVVYAVYDEQLDRRAALKLIRRDTGPELRTRLLREARAMAKLNHPNVVPVFEVGEHDGEPFIVMEYVRGQTLRQWLEAEPRTAEEILDKFAQAGEGLAAAHDLGLVHRDFKPDNAVVGEDDVHQTASSLRSGARGRVRVLDFGLVHREAGNDKDVTAMETLLPTPQDDAFETPLTHAAGLIGTPAYMAPEQFLGEATDAKTDQFAFCIALWEALCGERPFAGKSKTELVANVTRGVIRPPPPGAKLPPWMRPVLERGMRVDPGERWPSMRALLARCSPSRWRRRALWGVGAAAVAVAALGAWQLDLERRRAACRAEGEAIGAAWNDEARASVRDGLLATGVGHAAVTSEKVTPWLDAYAAEWATARTGACLDAKVRGTIDQDLLGRTQWCLEERRMELEAVVTRLRDADVGTVPLAVPLAAGLRPVAPCRDAALLSRLPAPPTASLDEVQAVQAELARAEALEGSGAYGEALPVARAALERAEAVGWPRLIAGARLRVGSVLEAAGDFEEAEAMSQDAYFEAARADAFLEAFWAAGDLVFLLGYRGARYEEALKWSKHAEVMRAALPDPTGARESLALHHLGVVHYKMGSYEEAAKLYERALAIDEASGDGGLSLASTLNMLANVRGGAGDDEAAAALYERALTIYEDALGPDHPSVAMVLHNLANVYTGPRAEAEKLYARALDIRERSLGPDHPDVAMTLAALAWMRRADGAYDEAERLYARALEIRENAQGEDHVELALTLHNLAELRKVQGRYDDAAKLYERAVAIREKTLPEHPLHAGTLAALAAVRARQERFEEAAELYERSLAILRKAYGGEHPSIATTLNNVALLHSMQGSDGEAQKRFSEALQMYERTVGPDDSRLAAPLYALASIALEAGRAEEAVPLARRAVELREADGTYPADLALTRFLLARVLVEADEDAPHAIALAKQARDALREAGDVGKAELEDVEAWLRTHAPDR